MATLRVAKSSHTVMSCIKHQVLELVAFIDKQMVDAHLLEVAHVIRARLYLIGNSLQLRFKVELPLLQSAQHLLAYLLTLCPQHFKIFLHAIKFCL